MSHHRPATGERCAVEVVRDVRIPTGDPGITLSADLYRPVTTGPVPALVTVVPYRKDFHGGLAHDGPARWFAARGYAGLLVDLRGIGSSDGVRRPEFDPGEADDAVAAIDWVAGQDWCDGAVGMWGHSYAATVTMRAASRRPTALRAIIPLMHGLDPGRDTVHPDGARGDLHALVNRGTSMLVQQLLPPLTGMSAQPELRRWHTRLHDTEPIFMDFARHGPGDPTWRERAIDGEAIVAPALCVGGWHDAFPDALIQAYERIRGPKKLIVGPWGHVLPQDSGVAPVDFLALALRWWDHWLRGVDTGIMTEPPVTLYVAGAHPSWRGYESWPPAPDIAPIAATLDQEPDVRVEYRPDPTAGTLRGLPGLCLGESCLPQDQHDDDIRSVCATSDPLGADLVIAGRTEVLVKLAGDHDGRVDAVRRLVVRLTQVDDAGRSTLVTAGVLCPTTPSASHRVVLRPVAYRVPAGRRLRVAISDADFPRLTPLAEPSRLRVVGVELSVPTTSVTAGEPVSVATLPVPTPPDERPTDWTITRDHVRDGVEVAVMTRAYGENPWYDYRFEASSELSATVHRAAPESVVMRGANRAAVWLDTGDKVVATATLRCTQTTLWAQGEVTIDDLVVYSRVWEATLPPCTE